VKPFIITDKKNLGAVAQLAEHLHGMQGVRGSNPLSSTN
tara:strand:- start:617 stop:733 length:117 start_codon:yes stop_codon:yes gene_type:complete